MADIIDLAARRQLRERRRTEAEIASYFRAFIEAEDSLIDTHGWESLIPEPTQQARE
jgi:hypothetical protein